MGLVLGIDPSRHTIPTHYIKNGEIDVVSWGKDVMDVSFGYVVGVKFQIAYFESLGIYGLTSLIKLIEHSKALGFKTIMDAKRGDIGSTSMAYAQAYLSDVNAAGTSEFSCDFLTINPLMGEDGINPFVDMAIKNKKGVFILLETSNPGAKMILKQQIGNQRTISEKIAEYICLKHKEIGVKPNEIGPIGCVVGATNKNVSHWREKLPNSLFLMPGIGVQGGQWENSNIMSKQNE